MPTDNDQFHQQFIHNVFGCFIENTLDYFADYLYPRFKHQVVGTYDKAVEYITKEQHYGREGDKPNLPALILNPTGDFNLDDANSLAHQFWRFPHLAPAQASGIFEPIYIDNNVEVTVAFTRLKGELELLSLLPSFYEYFDLKIFLIQMFGGEGRYIEPVLFDDFIILPDELINYKYENPYTNQSYTLDWSTNAYEFLVKTTNQNELVVPGKVKPRYVLRGLSDGSTRYGGTDDMADWKLSAIVEYEIEIPSYIILKTDNIIENINFEIRYGSTYSNYDEYNVPASIDVLQTHVDSGLQEDKNTIDNEGKYNYQEPPPEHLCDGEKLDRHIDFKTRYFHEMTQEQIDSTGDIIITMPEQIFDKTLLKVQSKDGLMDYGDHYVLENSGNDLRIKVDNVSLDVGDMIELFIYEVPFGAEDPIFVCAGTAVISTTGETPNRTSMIIDGGLIGVAECTFIETFAPISISDIAFHTLTGLINSTIIVRGDLT